MALMLSCVLINGFDSFHSRHLQQAIIDAKFQVLGFMLNCLHSSKLRIWGTESHCKKDALCAIQAQIYLDGFTHRGGGPALEIVDIARGKLQATDGTDALTLIVYMRIQLSPTLKASPRGGSALYVNA